MGDSKPWELNAKHFGTKLCADVCWQSFHREPAVRSLKRVPIDQRRARSEPLAEAPPCLSRVADVIGGRADLDKPGS